ncbi:hypothetical protein JRO89_XS05G0084400 [Xanthoceras sorbifolium]|uniref:CRM domain-containing protein n=1 Tax=Xanthoceras sorbifolium TaxID=99658 RepID=A0ABQ8I1K9_9ROSI|nr:hypothetical protein JRO89_XS05G0084400 [Xanthoceras sorbifolium]
MAILASLRCVSLFTSLPSNPPPNDSTNSPSSTSPPIPIPKYPPSKSKPRNAPSNPKKSQSNPALKLPHRQTHYYKRVKPGVISSDGERTVVVGESGVSYQLPGAPFEFQYSYSETPQAKPVAIREPAFLPFAPPTMPRPWTGKQPLKKSKKKTPLFDSFDPPPPGKKGVKYVEMPGPFQFGKYPKEGHSREEVLGEPLKKWEISMLVKPMLSDNRQVNLGRDGLTHNMLDLVHTHWKRRRVCKVKCKGVPTIDMDNVCSRLEEKTGGKIIHRVGGVVYLFRAKNGVYITLVKDVKNAFEGSSLVKIDCKGMHASDYKKLGAKLKELVPCVLLSFDDEQILMWRGKDWKSMYPEGPAIPQNFDTAGGLNGSGKPNEDDCKPNPETVRSSPKMMSLWKRAIESSKALLLDEINLGPDDLLKKSMAEFKESEYHSDDDIYPEDDIDDDDEYYDSDSSELDPLVPIGSLPVDQIAERLRRK